jgi:hypothetical protein
MSTLLNTSIEPQFRTIDGLKIRFAESEQRDDHALLLSPWPESVHAFDQMWHRLAEHAHLVAVDLPGFGHSERRDSLLAPRAMGEFVIRLADEFRLEQPHTVGPDIGTGALLFAAADNPGRLRSIVLGRGIERYDLPDTVKEDYLSAYEGDRFVESMRYVRAYPTELPILADLLPQIETPVEIIVGLGGAAEQPPVPPRAAAQEQARPDRRRPLHLGRRRGRIREDRHQLVGRGLRQRRIWRVR